RVLALAAKIDAGAIEVAQAKVLQWLRDAFGKQKKTARAGERNWSVHANTLIEIHLQQGDLPEAWEIAAESGVQPDLLQRLADASWRSHPGQAMFAYRCLVESEVAVGNNHGYRRALDLLVRQRDCMQKHKV